LTENASFDVLIDKIRPAVFAVGDKKNEREGKVHKVTRRYISGTCGADNPWADSNKNRLTIRNQISIFVIKLSGVSDLQRVKIPVYPLTLLAIVTTVDIIGTPQDA